MNSWLEGVRSSICTCVTLAALSVPAGTFRVATWNLESYLDVPTQTRPAKSPEAKLKVRQNILAIAPDIIALQEVGSTNALLELRDSLRADGLNLPYCQHIGGFDTNIHVGILSRLPFARVQLYTNEQYLLSGRRFHVSRGFGEFEIQVTPNYSFTLLTAHLKSKRAIAMGDETEMRLEEAKLFREKIDARLAASPNVNLVVLGDFNDTKDSASTKAIIGCNRQKLVDTRPAERNGDSGVLSGSSREPRTVTWTHYYNKEDTYTRIDFLLLSQGMAREWVTNQTYVLAAPDWGLASDHRPIVATFECQDK